MEIAHARKEKRKEVSNRRSRRRSSADATSGRKARAVLELA